jgi:hypothetical protein
MNPTARGVLFCAAVRQHNSPSDAKVQAHDLTQKTRYDPGSIAG